MSVLCSDTAERLRFVLHCDVGPLLFCVWYRPPCPGVTSAISTLGDELQSLRDDVLGTVVLGDLNCHHSGWLRFSSGVSTEGRFLKQTCATCFFFILQAHTKIRSSTSPGIAKGSTEYDIMLHCESIGSTKIATKGIISNKTNIQK